MEYIKNKKDWMINKNFITHTTSQQGHQIIDDRRMLSDNYVRLV